MVLLTKPTILETSAVISITKPGASFSAKQSGSTASVFGIAGLNKAA
jgi:hypothetical protein